LALLPVGRRPPLIEAAWPELAIEESNLTVQIAALRRVLEEAAGGATWIQTLPRRGYRDVGPVVATDNSLTDVEGWFSAGPDIVVQRAWKIVATSYRQNARHLRLSASPQP
jgi:DNA-binding winged helix-turn-helix (wHTH) protein